MTEPGLTAALAAVQAQLPHIQKGKTAQVRSEKGAYSYKYADLADVAQAIHPLLAAEGLAFITAPTLLEDGRFVLAYSLRHISGEMIEGQYPLPDASRVPAQQVGSAISYARRYCLGCVTGVVPDEDDDAQQVEAKASRRREKPAEGSTLAARAEAEKALTKGQGRAERGPLPADQDPWAGIPDNPAGATKPVTDVDWLNTWFETVADAKAEGDLKVTWAAMVEQHRKGHLTDEDRQAAEEAWRTVKETVRQRTDNALTTALKETA